MYRRPARPPVDRTGERRHQFGERDRRFRTVERTVRSMRGARAGHSLQRLNVREIGLPNGARLNWACSGAGRRRQGPRVALGRAAHSAHTPCRAAAGPQARAHAARPRARQERLLLGRFAPASRSFEAICGSGSINCRPALLQHILPCPPSAVALRVAPFSLVGRGKGPCGISATESAGTRRCNARRLGFGSVGNAPWPARGHPLLSPFCGSGSPLAVNPMRGSPSRAAR